MNAAADKSPTPRRVSRRRLLLGTVVVADGCQRGVRCFKAAASVIAANAG